MGTWDVSYDMQCDKNDSTCDTEPGNTKSGARKAREIDDGCPIVSADTHTRDTAMGISQSMEYMEAEPWFTNMGPQEVAELSEKLAKWDWDRKATLINYKVSSEERMKPKRQRLENIGL